jgi:uncharacterized protein YggT (Ycf19 family)
MTKDTTLYRSTQVIWYFFYVLESLLLFRFILKLLGANGGAGFTQLIYSITAVPMAPFRFVFGTNSVGASIFEWSTLLAMLVYYFVALALIKAFAMSRSVNEFEADQSLRAQDRG